MKRLLLLLLCSVMALICSSTSLWAQGCVVCTQTAASQGVEFGEGLNRGILYLAFLPLLILATLGFIFWRHRRSS